MLASLAVVRRMAAGLTVVALAGCAGQLESTSTGNAPAPQASSVGPTSASPSRTSVSAPTEAATRTRQRPPILLASDGKPRESRLTIPALQIKNLRVKPYRGSPDDARGTRIQNRGIAASPYGSDGGVGPGGIGNHIITAHRTSSTRAFAALPKLRNGAKVHLTVGGYRYTYRIVMTRQTSFRSAKSLAKQSAPVPRRPGVRPTKAMITLSTCRTPEDHAEGNYWSDEFGNPEHRIDKIGELIAIRPI
jgi:sortase A